HTRFSRDWSSDVCSSDLGDVFRETAVTIDADDLRVLANVLTPGAAVQALVTDHMAFERHRLPDAHAGHVRRHRRDLARNFMPHKIGRASCRERVQRYVSS